MNDDARNVKVLDADRRYQELFRRRCDTWMNLHVGSTGGKMSEAELREMANDVIEELRIDLNLDVETNQHFKLMIYQVLFGATRKLF